MDVGAVASIQCASGVKAEAVPNVAVSTSVITILVAMSSLARSMASYPFGHL
jgi:hypothetical protein